MTSTIKSLKFNADGSRFVVGTSDGFLVYETDPYKYIFSKHYFEGGLSEVAIIGKSAAVLFVGTGLNTNYAKNNVFIWDDKREKSVFNIVCKNDIKSLTARAQLIAVSTANLVHPFQLAPGPRKLPIHEIDVETADCVLLNNDEENPMMIYASKQVGEIKIVRYKWSYPNQSETNDEVEEKDAEIKNDEKVEKIASAGRNLHEASVQTIRAHANKLKRLAINKEGTLLATSSVKGTLIRIYDIITGTQVQELRRGARAASIMDICFSPESDYIAVISNTGTVHVYSVNKSDKSLPKNKKSSFSYISSVLPSYFSSEWGFSSITLETEWIQAGLILCFGQDNNSLVVIVRNGKYVRYIIDPINKKIIKDKERHWFNANTTF